MASEAPCMSPKKWRIRRRKGRWLVWMPGKILAVGIFFPSWESAYQFTQAADDDEGHP